MTVAASLRPKEPIFVVGYRRSGTTLAHSLLSSHRQVSLVPRESHFLNAFAPRYRQVDLSADAAFERCWEDFVARPQFARMGVDAEQIRTLVASAGRRDLQTLFAALLLAHAEASGTPRTGEKTPSHFNHIRTLLRWFPDGRVVFLVRDPRAVWASHLTVGQEWADLPAATIVGGWRRSAHEARRWRRSPSVRIVRYEDLARDPAETLEELFAWLGLNLPAHILERNPMPGPTGAYHHDGRVESGSVERWRSVLTAEQIAYIERSCAGEMAWYGYALDHGEASLGARLAAEARHGVHRARRLARPLAARLGIRRG